jgi:hypothetical protein
MNTRFICCGLVVIMAGLVLDTYRAESAALPPGILYFQRLGGPGTDNAWDMAVDASGSAYIAGMTDSFGDDFDAFVVKLNPNGTLAYARLFGGSALDQASKIAVAPDGSAYVAGYTYSADFPTTPGAYDRSFNGGDIDGFVTKLNPDGNIAYSTFLGGTSDDYGGGITVDESGQAFFTGYTESSGFPTTAGAFDVTFNGVSDVVIVHLNAEGTDLLYSTFAGGSSIEIGYDIAVDPAGSAYLTGQTMSQNFPITPGAFSTLYNGGSADAFVLKLDPDGQALAYGTYLGGNQFDDAKSIVVDQFGNAVVAGRTESENFPTVFGSYDRSYNGGRDAFITKLGATGAGLVYSTYVGGGGEEESGAISLGPYGSVFAAGWTFSEDFPIVPGAFDATHNGNYDAFLLVLWPSGDRLFYSTYLGTTLSDYGRGVGADAAGHAFIAGYTGFENVDAFGLKLDLIAQGAPSAP